MKTPKTNEEKAETLRQAEIVRNISVAAYKARLEDSSPGAVERMLEKDDDDGSKLRQRAASYDPLTRAYLAILRPQWRDEVYQRVESLGMCPTRPSKA